MSGTSEIFPPPIAPEKSQGPILFSVLLNCRASQTKVCISNLKATALSHLIISKGKAQLKQLGITTVFDLRSDMEMLKYDAPIPVIDGVSIIRAPVFNKDDYSPETMAK